MVSDLCKSFEYVLRNEAAPTGLGETYLDSLTEQVKATRAANPTKTVAVAFALYTKSQREYIRKITPEPVSFV